MELATAGDPFEQAIRSRAALRLKQAEIEHLAARITALPSSGGGELVWSGPPEAAEAGVRDAVSIGEARVAELARLDQQIHSTEAELAGLEAQRRKQMILLVLAVVAVVAILLLVVL